jgi:hypothetical protein
MSLMLSVRSQAAKSKSFCDEDMESQLIFRYRGGIHM